MNPEEFDPSNPEYKKVEDLPQEHQSEFSNVEGGFVRKEAVKELREAEASAKDWNSVRPFVERVTGKNKSTALDVLKRYAESADSFREEDIAEVNKIIDMEIETPGTSVKSLENMLGYLLGRRPSDHWGQVWTHGISKQQESRIREEIEKRKQQEE